MTRSERPNLYTIPSGITFVDTLAKGLVHQHGDELPDVTVYLPTRRAVRALREAYLRQCRDRAMLLPKMQPIGDIDDDDADLFVNMASLELSPAIPHMKRRLLLARLIRLARTDLGWAQAAELAADLCRLLDQLHMHDKELSDLKGLVQDREFAHHWEETLRFLEVLATPWQKLIAAQGYLEPIVRRNRSVALFIEQWRKSPPQRPIIAAGSTGSVKATADFLRAIADLPQGTVILPGLDQLLDAESWQMVSETHPQFAMKNLLEHFGVDRETVEIWPALDERDLVGSEARRQLASQIMRPAESSEHWRKIPELTSDAIAGLDLLRSAGAREEAIAIALTMRGVLEQPKKSAALVTPDRNLARRVADELRRWDVLVDDSAGRPLAMTPVGAFLRLLTEAINRQLAPSALLALLKHPLCRIGRTPVEINTLARWLDHDVLRGPRPAPGIAGLRAAIAEWRHLETGQQKPLATVEPTNNEIDQFVEHLEAILSPMLDLWQLPQADFGTLLSAHIRCGEQLTVDETDQQLLWHGDDGEAAAKFIFEVKDAAVDLPDLPPDSYPALFDVLMADQVVRPRYGQHPRLAIWGPLEARLQQTDLLILAGLNEGTWPALAKADPWINRPMQNHLGLATPEQRIGLSAHDFAQAFSAPQVLLSRSEKSDGTPTVPSRWILRLRQVLSATGLPLPMEETTLRWTEALDQPEKVSAISPPQPKPPLGTRCQQLSVTRIEVWLRDPYALYAERILGLRALEDIDADPNAASRGSAIHLALEKYLKQHGEIPPAQGLAPLLAIGEEVFAEYIQRPTVRAFWWPRFRRLAAWFLEQETKQRVIGKTVAMEVKGRVEIPYPGGTFRLTAAADRIDRFHGGGLGIIDYKTGAVPTTRQVETGLTPQLTLEAAIAEHGGFDEIAAEPVTELQYWRLSGGRAAGDVKSVNRDVSDLAAEAHAGLGRLIAAFADPSVPYRARPRPEVALGYNDYEHLARIKEWDLGGSEIS